MAFGDEVSDDEDTPETLAALAKEDRGEAQFSLPWPPALLGASDEFKEAVEKQQAERLGAAVLYGGGESGAPLGGGFVSYDWLVILSPSRCRVRVLGRRR